MNPACTFLRKGQRIACLQLLQRMSWLVALLGSLMAQPLLADSPASCLQVATPAWTDETNEDGSGLYFDLLRAVYQPLGIDLCFRIVPFNRVVLMLRNHTIDAAVAFYDEEDARSIGWDFYTTSRHAIGVERLIALFKQGTIGRWQYPQSLTHLRVAWIDGYGFFQAIGVPLEYQRITSQSQGWNLLKAGRIDVYMDSESDALGYARENGIDLSEYRIETAVIETLHIPFAKSARGQRFQQLFDQRMEVMWRSGELAGIYEKWHRPLPPRPTVGAASM